jgi:hypothetical protein
MGLGNAGRTSALRPGWKPTNALDCGTASVARFLLIIVLRLTEQDSGGSAISHGPLNSRPRQTRAP